MASTYTMSSCPKCRCAVGFSTVRDGETHRQQAGHRRTVSEWAVAGLDLRSTTSRDELDEHMKTWGDCTCKNEDPSIIHMPVTAWTVLPPAEGLCPTCAVDHEPGEPHNPDSLFWQTARLVAGEPAPTWTDALQHVTDPVRRALWIAALAKHGITIDEEGR